MAQSREKKKTTKRQRRVLVPGVPRFYTSKWMSRDDLKEMPTYNYYYCTPWAQFARIGFVCVCVYSDEFFIFAGDMRRAVENKCAVLRSDANWLGWYDSAPSFANQIHMTTGEDRRSTHAQTSSSGNHLANPGWQVNSSCPIVQQFRRFSLAEAATHDESRRREVARPYLLDDNDTHQAFAELMHRQYLFSHRHTSWSVQRI